jgi:hypothetical protein
VDAPKKGLYEMLGVSEYLVFDPLEEYLKPRFRAFQLDSGAYRPAPLGPGELFISRSLGVGFRPEGPLLRVLDPTTGEVVPLLEESVERATSEAEPIGSRKMSGG